MVGACRLRKRLTRAASSGQTSQDGFARRFCGGEFAKVRRFVHGRPREGEVGLRELGVHL